MTGRTCGCQPGICGWCGAPATRRVDDPRLMRHPEYICEDEWAQLPEDEQAEWIPLVAHP